MNTIPSMKPAGRNINQGAAPVQQAVARVPQIRQREQRVALAQTVWSAALMAAGSSLMLYALEPVLVARGVSEATVQVASQACAVGSSFALAYFFFLLAQALEG